MGRVSYQIYLEIVVSKRPIHLLTGRKKWWPTSAAMWEWRSRVSMALVDTETFSIVNRSMRELSTMKLQKYQLIGKGIFLFRHIDDLQLLSNVNRYWWVIVCHPLLLLEDNEFREVFIKKLTSFTKYGPWISGENRNILLQMYKRSVYRLSQKGKNNRLCITAFRIMRHPV